MAYYPKFLNPDKSWAVILAPASATNSASLSNSLPFAIGTQISTGTNNFNGYIDEFRITKGFARYTASFTPPDLAFPDSATQTATKYIGLVGGLNDTNVDYGIEKLSDSSLKIKKLTIEHPEAEINLVIKKPNSPVDDYKVKQILEDALLDILRHINKAK